MRAAGILLPVSSLPSPYGIGTFSKSAYDFIDQLKKAGQTYWQILPLGPTGYGDSPYQSFSAFAGNPYFIDLETLAAEGLLEKQEYDNLDFGDDPGRVDYQKLYEKRFPLLRKAYSRSDFHQSEEYERFKSEHGEWLEDYCLYMAVKNHFGGAAWDTWDEDIRMREADAVERYHRQLADEIGFYEFLQYQFYQQWSKLKTYANANGIQIVGDIPIYVAFDSADSWAHPELFQFDMLRRPSLVAGCPPDAFSADGQLWGNPLYNWEYHEQTGFEWWKKRIAHCKKLYDVVRIDHFRGFDEYYAIPYGDSNAARGCWKKGPGMKLFCALKAELGCVPIIAEDLGYLTPSVEQLVRDTGFPNMKVIEFAFDSREDGDYMPYTYGRNCVVYTGTHDNQTLQGWLPELIQSDYEKAMAYVGAEEKDLPEIHWEFIRLALGCTADTAIIAMQDYLGLGKEARMNHPSTLGKNWTWRLLPNQISEELIEKIGCMTDLYGRK